VSQTTSSPDQTELDPRRWLALGVLLVAAVMDIVDATIVNVALSSVQLDLGAGGAELEWLVAAYTLPFAVGLITGGRLGDVFGRRRIFLAGIGGFTIASVLSGLAQSPEALIAARALQGAMAALMVPQVLSTITASFAPAERPKAFGIFGAAIGMATVGAPLLGGALVEADILGLGWRPIFLINVPVGVATLLATRSLVRETRAEHGARIDLAGMGLATAALLALVYPLVQGHELGWPAWTFAVMAAAVPAGAAFVAHQVRRARAGRDPLVPLALFRERAFAGGVLTGLTFFSGVAGFFLMTTIALQQGLGKSPLETAATYLPWSLGILVASGASVQLAPRLGRKLATGGSLAMAAAMAALLVAVSADGTPSAWALAPGLLLGGLGMGMVAPTLMDVILAGVPERDAGSASGVVNTSMQVGGALGVAVVGAVFFGALPGGDPFSGRAAITGLDEVLWVELGIYLLSALLTLLLPRGASHDAQHDLPALAALEGGARVG
jgi:EmrB/QacA subfamily drug resistance transporter